MSSNVIRVGTGTNAADSFLGPIQGTGNTFANIDRDTVRPYTLEDMDVDTALRLTGVEKKLQIEATLDDVYVDVGEDVVFTGKKVMIPDAVVMRLSADSASHKQVIPLASPLAGPGRGGVSEDQPGFERGAVLRFMEAYYNEYSQAMAGEEWGVNYNQVQVFDLYGQIQPMLSKWFKEDTGHQYRESSLETFAWPLAKAGTVDMSTGLTQVLNSNFYVANVADGSQPSWDSTEQTYINAIATACDAADGGTDGSYANIDLDYLIALDEYAQRTKRISPVTLGGKKSYLVVLPSKQYKKLVQVNDGQLGSVWQETSALSEEEQNFPGIAGRVMSLVIIEDQRSPTIVFDQYTAGAAMTIEYDEPGNDDNRNTSVYNSTTNLAWDAGFLYGAPAIIDWERVAVHFETEKQNYGKDYGYGGFAERGIQLARYTNDSGSVNVNYGSMVLLFTACSLVTVAS
jgi:hypothetical protein